MHQRRLAHVQAHLAPTAEPAAGVVKWLSGLLGGGGDATTAEPVPVAVATHEAYPTQGVDGGHVHPDICRTAVRPTGMIRSILSR